MWIYIFQGLGLGLAAASQPGPFQTYIISQTLTRGWRRTLRAALAPLVSDGPIILISLLVLSQVPAWFQRFLYFAGGSFVLYLAYGTLMAFRDLEKQSITVDPADKKSVFKAALVNIVNPGPYIFWALVTGPVLLKGWRETPVNGIGFLAGFYAAVISTLAALILAFGLAARFGPKVNRAMLGISAIALFGFGLYQLWLGFFA